MDIQERIRWYRIEEWEHQSFKPNKNLLGKDVSVLRIVKRVGYLFEGHDFKGDQMAHDIRLQKIIRWLSGFVPGLTRYQISRALEGIDPNFLWKESMLEATHKLFAMPEFQGNEMIRTAWFYDLETTQVFTIRRIVQRQYGYYRPGIRPTGFDDDSEYPSLDVWTHQGFFLGDLHWQTDNAGGITAAFVHPCDILTTE